MEKNGLGIINGKNGEVGLNKVAADNNYLLKDLYFSNNLQ